MERAALKSKVQKSSDISALSIDALLNQVRYTMLGRATIASCKQCCAVQCSFRLAPLMLCTALVVQFQHTQLSHRKILLVTFTCVVEVGALYTNDC